MTRTVAKGTLVVRPITSSRYCYAVAAGVLVLFVVLALTLPKHTAGAAIGGADQVALAGLGLLIAGAILLPTYPRAIADANGLRLRGFVGGYRFVPWAAVRDIRFRKHWPVVVLEADEIVPMYAIQRADGERTVAVMAELRKMQSAAS